MYIRNVDAIKNQFKCGKLIALFLCEEKGLPVLGQDEQYYYFSNTDLLKEVLKNAPFYIKTYLWLEGNNWRKEG